MPGSRRYAIDPHPRPIDLAALTASRLCHDLVSPLGAIGNGLELLQMVSDPSPELALLSEAVASAQARLRLFRLAFGAAAHDQHLPRAELHSALAALETAGRLTVQTRCPETIARPRARRLALAALCAETALAWGGTIEVTETHVTARAARLRLDPPLWDSLRQGRPVDAPSSAQIHFALLAAEGAVTLTEGEGWLTLTP